MCTCIGEGRKWNIENNQCLCGRYYKPIDKPRSQDSDSSDNCELIEDLVCPIGEAFNEVTQSCVSESELISLQCSGGSGTYLPELSTVE